jgi:D-alanine-D-alanine ligase
VIQKSTKKYGKIAVLMGGQSAEREISLKSGNAVLQALLNAGIDAVGIDTQADFLPGLLAFKPDRVFIALHGRGGEDGTIQGLLETLKLPYSGSRVLGSALAMDKYRAKQIWQSMGLPTPPAELLTAATDFASVVQAIGLPLMVKPASEGSSVGMSLVKTAEELPAAWKLAAEYDNLILAEKYITGREYTASILHDRVLPLIRLETPRQFYDYAAKYIEPTTSYICPCGLPAEQEQAIQALAWSAFQALGASGWGRVDLMVDMAGKAWLLEVNTVPGMTDHSLVPMAAKTAGIQFDDLVLSILDSSWQ